MSADLEIPRAFANDETRACTSGDKLTCTRGLSIKKTPTCCRCTICPNVYQVKQNLVQTVGPTGEPQDTPFKDEREPRLSRINDRKLRLRRENTKVLSIRPDTRSNALDLVKISARRDLYRIRWATWLRVYRTVLPSRSGKDVHGPRDPTCDDIAGSGSELYLRQCGSSEVPV